MNESMRNDLVRNSIDQLNATGTDTARADLYRQLTDGFLFVAVAAIPPGIETTGTVLPEDTSVSMLTTMTPDGGTALLAFTDLESLHARVGGAPYMVMNSRQVFELFLYHNNDI